MYHNNCNKAFIKTHDKMTTLQMVQFAAQIQVGTVIKTTYQTMVVTSITEKRIYGYDKKRFDLKGKKEEISLEYETIMNPHYNKDMKIAK